MFDCGGNTQDNKRRIRDLKFHYLTLKAKKKGPYRNEIAIYNARRMNQISFISNNRVYSCVKYRDGEEVRYIFSQRMSHTTINEESKET